MNCPYCQKSCEIIMKKDFYIHCQYCGYSSPRATMLKDAIDKHETLYNHSRLWNVIINVLNMSEDKFYRLILKCEPFIGKKGGLEEIISFIEDEWNTVDIGVK